MDLEAQAEAPAEPRVVLASAVPRRVAVRRRAVQRRAAARPRVAARLAPAGARRAQPLLP
jgi:hypothetical protein